jgi:hypothetical protein
MKGGLGGNRSLSIMEKKDTDENCDNCHGDGSAAPSSLPSFIFGIGEPKILRKLDQ